MGTNSFVKNTGTGLYESRHKSHTHTHTYVDALMITDVGKRWSITLKECFTIPQANTLVNYFCSA